MEYLTDNPLLLLLIAAYLIAPYFLIAPLGKNTRLGFYGSYAACIFLTPGIGLLAALIASIPGQPLPKKQKEIETEREETVSTTSESWKKEPWDARPWDK